MSDRHYLDEYRYTGITGQLYIPYTQNGKWYLIPDHEIPFLSVVYFCKIPAEEATVLKLKYGLQK